MENKESWIYLLFSIASYPAFYQKKKEKNTTEILNTVAYVFPKQHYVHIIYFETIPNSQTH